MLMIPLFYNFILGLRPLLTVLGHFQLLGYMHLDGCQPFKSLEIIMEPKRYVPKGTKTNV